MHNEPEARTKAMREWFQEIFTVNLETGLLFWKQRLARRNHIGDLAGGLSSQGYWIIRINGTLYKRSDLIWLLATGNWPVQLDHWDRVRTNDSYGNLRERTQSQNVFNSPIRTNNTSGTTGVSYNTRSGKYRSYIIVRGTQIELGMHKNIEDAIAARKAAELKYFGENP